VANNAGPSCSGIAGTVTDGGHDIVFPDTGCPGANVDPTLGALTDNGGPTTSQALNAGSPALDAGPPSGADCPASDQRGVSRPQGPGCDIGAFERSVPGSGGDGGGGGGGDGTGDGGGDDAAAAFGAKTLVTLRLAARRIPARGPLKVRVRNRNDFVVRGKLSGRTVKKVTVAVRRRVRLRARGFRVGANARKTVKLKLPRPLRRVLRRKGSLRLRLTAKVKDPAGNRRTVRKTATVRLKR